jgi:hypothetical protein
LYSIYEESITTLPPPDLRPVLKSLILSLLPGLEDETSEDFDRAFRILESLEQKYSPSHSGQGSIPERDGYFWQCLFLAIITSSTRRQGALNFLVQKLPKFSSRSTEDTNPNRDDHNKSTTGLSPIAEAVISPEPGLLIRCFACGLSDSQALIQRGFLDLLVSNLPLDSPLLQSRVQVEDLDRLVSAAAQVLLRREMSLNRRLWSWFLGPDPKANGMDGNQPSSPMANRKQSLDTNTSTQLKYFSTYGRKPLERCILAMFKLDTKRPTQRAHPFRICLSLMDRWEIGGSIIPQIFVPAIGSAYQYSLSASKEDTAEVLRSASLFFDGIEATLIWEHLLKLLRDGLSSDTEHYKLRMFDWVVHRFNVNDEEMLTVHIPYAATYLLSILSEDKFREYSTSKTELLYSLVSQLLNIVPERAFIECVRQPSDDKLSLPLTTSETKRLRDRIDSFYQSSGNQAVKNRGAFGTTTWIEMCYQLIISLTLQAQGTTTSEPAFVRAAILLTLFHSKASKSIAVEHDKLFGGVAQGLQAMATSDRFLPFPDISSIISLMTALGTSQFARPVILQTDLVKLIPDVATQAWRYLSPSYPKYNVEAVKSIWQLQELTYPDDCLEADLMSLVREGLSRRSFDENDRTETCRRFAVLWNHTIPVSAMMRGGSYGFARKGSAMPAISDAVQALNRQKILMGPLMLVLDELRNANGPTFHVVRAWLQNLNSLDHVLRIIFRSFEELSKTPNEMASVRQISSSRWSAERVRDLEYTIGHILWILKLANEWVWQCLEGLSSPTTTNVDTSTAVVTLADRCISFLRSSEFSSTLLRTRSVEILDILLSSPLVKALKGLDLDSRLLDKLMESLTSDKGQLQDQFLKLIIKALRLSLGSEARGSHANSEPRNSITARRSTIAVMQQSLNASNTSLAATPPPQLLNCLKMGFSSSAARPHLDQWLAFLSSVLPVYADAIFASIIPLVECLCAELDKAHQSLIAMSQINENQVDAYAPESATLGLLEALEMVLDHAHECLADEQSTDATPKSVAPPRSILGNMTSGVFKSEALPTRTAQTNSRLTVILTFQDAIKASTKLWTWASHSSVTPDFDKGSAATTTYNALRLRNRTRYLLEQMFDNEPLESLEVLTSNWFNATSQIQASATLDLLHVMQGMRPKVVVPTILDSICSRTNPSALPTQRQSSQTVDLTPVAVTAFLFAYLQSIEDDAMDEVWTDCMAFLRDVLSNPLPYRQVLPGLLSIILLLAQKIDKTNFGEQRKMRRDLGDTFLRLLGATFTTMPSGYVLEPAMSGPEGVTVGGESKSTSSRKSTSLPAVLTEITLDLEVILETPDRVLNAMNNITSNLISPIVHAKLFPGNVNAEILSLFLQISKRAPAAKHWKKDIADAFNDPKLLSTSVSLMENAWFPLLHQWCLYDKERMPELLSRLSPPSSAGIMFGVGASAARLEADRKTQFNLRRVCILLLCAPEDSFVLHSRTMEEKLVELFDASVSSSPSASVKAELFMLCRALVLSTSAIHLAPFWPIINDNLTSALTSLLPSGQNNVALGNLSLLQGCKLLDLLTALAPEEFQLHEWLYVTDTIDAVYQPSAWTPSALSDHIAEGLASNGPEDGNGDSMIPPTPITSTTSGKRRPLISNSSITDIEDIKASTREDFAQAVVRPFLSQLSLHAYEGVYSMDTPDVGICKRELLEDLLDLRTIVE